ncbi:hypothetical protein RB595_007338 [Gaeumannomyces hyphopodioides]
MSGSSSTTSTARRATRDEEKASLLRDDKTLSDIESDAGRAEIETKFPHAPRARSWLAAVGACAGNKLIRAPPWRTAAVRAVFFLVPSFLRHHHSPAAASGRDFRRSQSRVDRLGPTSYLDGMRGVAAFVVFLCHYFYTCFRVAEGWGYNGNDGILTLPIFRLWYQGPPMVAVFFVVSGYALSIKPLRLARAAARGAAARRPPSTPSLPSAAPPPSPSEEFSATLSSFVFRRFFRLFLPTAASTLMVAVLLRAGVYEWTRDFAHDERFMRNVQELHPERLGSLALQLRDWARAMFEFIHVWGWEPFGGSTAYDVHLWTIPVEFRCSMVLFTTLAGVGRLHSWVRLLVFAILVLFCYRSGRWDMFLFYCGAVLAELDLIRDAETDPGTTAAPAQLASDRPGGDPRRPRGRTCASLWWLASIAALYLMSQPDFGAEETPGWVFLSSLVPEYWADDGYRHWQSVGAVLFVASVARLPRWQALFNLAPARYLGRVSYALYLVHGPVLHTAGYLIEMRTFAITTAGGQMITDRGYVAGFALGAAFVVPIVVWAADVFWRAVDAPVVLFARRLEAACSV